MKLPVEAACAAALALVAAPLAFVPLFDLLGYEWCLAMALPAAIAGAVVAVAHARRQRAFAVAQLFAGAVMRAWLVLAPAFVLIVANAARVHNCGLGTGFVWLALLPLGSAAMGAALGAVVALVRPWRSRWAPALLALAAITLSIVWGLIRFYRAPPIAGYDPFAGWFAGSLYDEDVAPTAALLWSRLYQAAIAGAPLGACALFRDEDGSLRARAARAGACRSWSRSPRARLAPTLGSAHARLGFSLNGDDVARALGAERHTAHFVLHYSPTGPYARDLDAEALDVELRWAELERVFSRAQARPVHAFLFDSPEQKRAILGAGDTVFANAWRREIYVQWDGWPQLGFAHELAHVFAGVFGDPLLASSRDGVRFNVGLIEGVAVAATWSLWEPWQPLTPHQTVRVLGDAGPSTTARCRK